MPDAKTFLGSSQDAIDMYVAQFLAHLEHSGYAILRGEKNRPFFPLKFAEMLGYNGNPMVT